MREDRVFEPYKVKSKLPKSPLAGRIDTHEPPSSEKAAESAPPAESVALSPAAAALARKEQRFFQQQTELKAREKALEAERAEIAELKAMKAKLAQKDFTDLEKLVPYEDYTQHLINKQPQSEEAKRLAEIQARIDKIEGTQKQSLEERMADAVETTRGAVKSVVDTNADFAKVKDFKFHDGTKELKFEDAVVQHILDSLDQDNVELTPEQAAKEVKTLLVEQAKNLAVLNEAVAQAAPVEEKKPAPPKAGIPTLTQNMAAAGEAKRPNRPYQGMSDSERWAEARRRAEDRLKAQKPA